MDKKSIMQVTGLCVVVVVLMGSLYFREAKAVNGCCSFPCQNNGVCMTGREPGSYTCDCSNLPYYGTHCETPYLTQRIVRWLKPLPDTIHNIFISPWFSWLFAVINRVSFLENLAMKKLYLMRSDKVDSPPLYETVHDYATIKSNFNQSVYARTLPPVPPNCPTPMGTKGPKELPDVDVLMKFFKRTKFRPEPMGSSVLMTFFAQHFVHMFFMTDFKKGSGASISGHGVDVTSLYGINTDTEDVLRSFKDGKLKLQTLNGEEYPMYLKDAPVHMLYPSYLKEDQKFALGHSFFGLLPGLFLFQTIWMREHNRVCDVLKYEHPDWDDERLFQTGKLIILGETIKIVIEDYVQHLANYNVKLKYIPEVLFGEPFQYQNKIAIEFNHLYHWHPLMPDDFNITGKVYEMKDFMFHSEIVVNHGTAAVTEAFSRQRAGHMSHHNHGASTMHVMKKSIKHGRELRFQPLNKYRERFGMPAYKSFEELTGETVLAAELRKLYHDVNAIEFIVGMFMERRRDNTLFGATVIEMGGAFSVKGLLANPISSPQFWKPSTFGGEVGFNIIKTATLEKLFCANIKGKCPTVLFRVPDFIPGDVDEKTNFEVSRVKDEL